MRNQKKQTNFPGNLAELDVAELYRAANTHLVVEGITVADVASDAGTRSGRVYAYQDDDAATLTTVTAIVTTQARLGAPYVLERMARDAGFLLVAAPKRATAGDKSAITAASTVMRETVEAVEAFAAAVDDGVVTRREFIGLAQQVAEAEAKLEALKAYAAELVEHESDLAEERK